MDDHVETLRRYNRWRRGQDCEEMQDPRVVGDAIDAACDKIDRLRAELAESQTNARISWENVELRDAEIERLQSDIARHIRRRQEQSAEIRRLRAELAEAKQDAERYRWVRDKAFRCDPDMSGNHTWWSVQPRPKLRGNTIDAAIDAALAAEGE